MMIQILTHTPAWVWGILLLLVVLGYTQTRDRLVAPLRLMIVPFVMSALSFQGTVSSFGKDAYVIAAFVFSLLLSIWLGFKLSPANKFRFAAATRKIHVTGSWIPMILMLGIFITKYILNVLLVVAPEVLKMPVFAGSFILISGVFSGIFLSRGVHAALVYKSAMQTQAQDMQIKAINMYS